MLTAGEESLNAPQPHAQLLFSSILGEVQKSM